MVEPVDIPTFCNGTSVARNESRADASFLLFNCTVLTLTLLLGLPGNLWVCWVVLRTKSLQTCNNALLVSLATSDLLKCSVDTPLLLFSFLRYGERGRVSVPVAVCTVQQFTYALCSCVQLLTLVGISVERFQAIAHPFQTEGRRARVRLWIPSIWACGLVLAAVSLTLSEEALLYMLCRPHAAGTDRERLRYSDPFGPYVLVPVWGLCITLIVVHYTRIFKVVRQHRKKVFNLGVQLRPTVSGDVWAWVGDPRGSTLGPPPPPRRAVLLVAEAGAPCAGSGASACITGAAPGRPPEIVGAVCLMTPGARERGKKQMEGKVAQRFGYIIIAFTLFWAPMVVLLLVNVASTGQDTNSLLMELETSALVLTCMQAAVDPLIYTLVTRQFRSELRKVLPSILGCPLRPRA